MPNNMETTKTIETIETELSQLFSADTKSWVKIYKLMDRVEREKLFAEQYKSYTAWVNSFAERTKINVSLMWSRKKAGKYYSEYEQRQRDKGIQPVPLTEVTISPDNFVLVEKIAGSNCDVADNLIGKVVSGDLKRSDLRNAWNTVKSEREQAGIKVQRKNAYDKPEPDIDGQTSLIQMNGLTAADVVMAFRSDGWIAEEDRVDKKYSPGKYHIMTEFAVETGTSRHARRMDILIIETLTARDNHSVTLHGVEIKVTKSDLLGDTKMQEYTEYCDRFWIAVPTALVSYAEEVATKDWGIIAVSDDKELTVIRKAERNTPMFRDKTISTAVIKLL